VFRQAEGEFKRVDHAVVMIGALGFVSGRGQSGGRKLESRVIRNVEPPIGN
jgi:hypothetical protein